MSALDLSLAVALAGAPWWKGAAVAGLAAVIVAAAAGRLRPWRPPPGTGWLAALFLWRAASAAWSEVPAETLWKSFRTAYLLPYVLLAGTAAPVDRARPVRAFLASAAVLAAYGLVASVVGADAVTGRLWPLQPWGEFRGMFADRNQAGALMAFAGLLALGTTWSARRRRATDALLPAAFGPAAVLLSHSRSAFLGLLAGCAAWAATRGRRAAVGGAVALALLLGVAAAFPPTRSALARFASPAEDPSVHDRWLHWRAAAAVVAERPVVGVGYKALGDVYARRMAPRLVAGVDGPDALHHAHNQYLTIAAETGVVGLALYLGLWGAILLGLLRAGAPHAAAALFALLVADVFERNLDVEAVVLPVAISLGLALGPRPGITSTGGSCRPRFSARSGRGRPLGRSLAPGGNRM